MPESTPDPLRRQLAVALDSLEAASNESRPLIAYAHRAEALKAISAVQRELDTELRAASEAVEEHLLAQGVANIKLTSPAVTVYIERRLFAGIDYREGEDTDTGHERAAAALREAGLGEFAHERVNLQGLAAHYREAGEEVEEALRGAISLSVVTRVKTRKNS